MGYSYPIFYVTDAERGWALQPNIEGWYRKEGEAYVRINSDGLRDIEHTKAKPEGTLRIAVVGDSYAEALQVSLEETFWKILERRLQESCPACAGKRVEVVNFGVSGYGTAQELLTLQRHVRAYSPDIVLLAFTTSNDISDNSRLLKKTDDIPYFIYRDGQLVLDDSFRDSASYRLRVSPVGRLAVWLRGSSRVVQLFHQAHAAFQTYMRSRKMKADVEAKAAREKLSDAARPKPPDPFVAARYDAAQPAARERAVKTEELGVDNAVYLESDDPAWNEAWRVTEKLVALMRDEAEGQGARFFVVTLSNGIQVYPDAAARQAFMERLGVRDIFYPDRRIAALGERERIKVFTLAPALQLYAERNRAFLHGFGRDTGNGHWNALGHRVAGELLAEQLCRSMATTD
jgi:lysophospholipase L1-like esterase